MTLSSQCPGATKLHRLKENVGAAAVELTPDDLSGIDGAVSKIAVQGPTTRNICSSSSAAAPEDQLG